MVQGIIDLYYIDKNDNLVLIDFKTDYISNEPNAKEKILEKIQSTIRNIQNSTRTSTRQKSQQNSHMPSKRRVLFGNIVVVYY